MIGFETDSFANYVSKRVKSTFESVNIDNQEYYYHPTYCITNLSDYIKLISLISSAGNSLTQGDAIIFRGISDKDYDLKPGLARIPELFDDTEGKMINDFLTRRPDAFKDLNDFDIVAKMQHYGLPTRLLDFSTNPLVALFFACEAPYSKKDGRVLCHFSFLQNDKSELISAICKNAVNKPFDGNNTVDEYLCSEGIPLIKYLREFYFYGETTIVRPKYWNQRIANQAGVFMLFPNNLLDKYKGIIQHSGSLGLEKAIEQYGRSSIDKNALVSILQTENMDYYRNEEELYLTEKCFTELLKVYGANKELLANNTTNRFIIKRSLKMPSKEVVSNQFCSIIIESKYKKKMLQDLSYIGIGTDYIYPELEYAAKEIKSQYV